MVASIVGGVLTLAWWARQLGGRALDLEATRAEQRVVRDVSAEIERLETQIAALESALERIRAVATKAHDVAQGAAAKAAGLSRRR